MKHPQYDSEDLLLEVFDGISVYFNFTKSVQCLDYTESASSQLGEEGWDFQVSYKTAVTWQRFNVSLSTVKQKLLQDVY